jgi:hypothetical protein
MAPRARRTPEKAAKAVKAAANGHQDDEGRLIVATNDRNPIDPAREAAAHLIAGNDPSRLFKMGSKAAVEWNDDRGQLVALDDGGWLLHTADRVTFMGGASKKGPAPIPAPFGIMRMIPSLVTRHLPPVDGIATTPYLAADGELIDTAGYDPGTRRILHAPGLALPPVPGQPTPDEVAAAVKLLTVDWLGDFPFTSDADLANMVSLLLTLTGRMFFALAPLFILDASTAGAGKNLLATTVSLIATGTDADVMMLPDDGKEQRKKVTTALMEGRELIVWDESHTIAGRTLAAILTAERYSDRILGGNKMMTVDNRFTQLALGNNVLVRGDLRRRSWPARLVPDTEHPEHRDGWRHPYLAEWVREHRADLLAAVLVIWRNWIAEGRPEADITVGSFEKWARTVGGALAAAGIAGLGGNVTEWLSFSDDDADDGWSAYLARLARHFVGRRFTTADVAAAVTAAFVPAPPCKYDPDKPLPAQVAYAFRGQREKWHDGRSLVRSPRRDSETGTYTWTIRERSPARAENYLQDL